MKKLIFLTVIIFTLLSSCEKNDPNESLELSSVANESIKNVNATISTYPNNEIIVKYVAGFSEAQKQATRNRYKVSSYKRCSCTDTSIELWIFRPDETGDLPGGSIEEIVIGAKEDSGLEGVDFNPIIQQNGQNLNNGVGFEGPVADVAGIVPENSDLTIAILDTGLDYNYFGFNNPFLYNSQLGSNPCNDNGMTDLFGWDFVNNDNNPYDDYGHGTVVASIIYKLLNNTKTPFQILPVKIFDHEGKASYFNIICGFAYAANNPDVDIINMSFGWYNQNFSILENYIAASQNQVLITTSAGNLSVNTDIEVHYPSSFLSSNILSVAALENNESLTPSLAWFSNFGQLSVDIAAQGENIPFYLSPSDYIYVAGTSFSNAIAAAFAGMNYESGMAVGEHYEKVISKTIQHPNLAKIKYRSYIGNQLSLDN